MIAVIGIGCRFPGGMDSPAALWRLLVEGRETVREGPFTRWGEAPATIRWGGFFDDVTRFDAAFFGVPPREAKGMDPQHRLLLEVTWEALEHAGIAPHRLAGTDVGVFAGLCYMDYLMRLGGRYQDIDAYSLIGNVHSAAPGRISYLLGLHGPSMAVDAACSSSLVAVHLACQSLRLGECNLALAGGVNLLLTPEPTISLSRWRMFSTRGRCFSFDARADGYVRGEGCGVVVLKRLDDARRDGDRVLAVIRGSAVNSDGRSHGLTAPHPGAQRAVARAALARAGVDPGDVGLVEAHGTGTPLGDRTEFAALAEVYGTGRGRCALGALKTNLGHTEAAAGIAGLIKAVLSVSDGTVPPNLHFGQWHPDIDADGTRLFVPTATVPWPVDHGTRLAAVSSFGMTGTNAHVVLEQPAPARTRQGPPSERLVFPVSSGSTATLGIAAQRLADWLEETATPLADVAHTLATRRTHGPARLAVVARTRDELIARLRGGAEPETVRDGAGKGPLWIFSGQGSQVAGVGRSPLAGEPAFVAAIDEIDPLVAAESGFSVRDSLYATQPETAIDRVQPVLFATQMALAAVWRAHGVEPSAVLGQSLGEVAAAVVAGALPLRDGVRVICRRSRLLAGLAGAGATAFVNLPADEVAAELTAATCVAGVSSPRMTVVAGEAAEVHRLLATWQARGLFARAVAVDVAAHSPQVDPILDRLAGELADLAPTAARLPFYSTVTADPRVTPACDAAYWVANMRRPIRLSGAVSAAAADGYRVFVEVSPHPVLSYAVEETLAGSGLVVHTIERDRDEMETLGVQLARLYRAGVPIDWERRYGDGALADVPTTAWDHRRRYWIDLATTPPTRRLDAMVHEVSWQAAPLPVRDDRGTGPWLVVGEDGELAGRVGELLDASGAPCTVLVVPYTRRLDALRHTLTVQRYHGCAVLLNGAAARDLAVRLVDVVAHLSGGPPPRLWVVTHGALAQAPLRGLGRVLMHEQPQLRTTLVDLDPALDDPGKLAEQLAPELLACGDEDEVAWRDGERFVARLVHRPPAAPARPYRLARAGGGYILTGGLGGIGLALARRLAERGATRIVLNGRSAPSGAAAQAIAALPADVEVVLGDIAEPGVAERLVAAAEANGATLRGIGHGAAVYEDDAVTALAPGHFDRVWRPKVDGALRLHEATAGRDLDWFVMFSSTAAMLGSRGLGAYASANAWLDAFAAWRRAQGLPALSIAWGPWGEAGAATGLAVRGYAMVSVADGLDGLEALLADGRVWAGVFHHDPLAWFSDAPALATSPFFSALPGVVEEKPPAPQPSTMDDIRAQLDGLPPARRSEAMRGYLAARIAETLQLATHPTDPETLLVALGFDSLTALQLRARLQADLAVPVPTTVIWTYPTLAELAEHLLERIGAPR